MLVIEAFLPETRADRILGQQVSGLIECHQAAGDAIEIVFVHLAWLGVNRLRRLSLHALHCQNRDGSLAIVFLISAFECC
jgi:hypothetical protein